MGNTNGDVTRCNKCDEPLARIEKDKVYTLKRQGGKIVEFEMEVIHGEDRGHLKLKCDNCDSNNFLTRRVEKLSLGDNIKRLWKKVA